MKIRGSALITFAQYNSKIFRKERTGNRMEITRDNFYELIDKMCATMDTISEMENLGIILVDDSDLMGAFDFIPQFLCDALNIPEEAQDDFYEDFWNLITGDGYAEDFYDDFIAPMFEVDEEDTEDD